MTDSNTLPNKSYNAKRTAVLFDRFELYWGHRWKEQRDAVTLELALEEWGDAILNIPDSTIKSALTHCRNTLEWPPSIAEFLKICDREQGMPSPQEVMQLAIRRDFSHPMTQAVYNKIGSWDFSHDSEKDLLAKVKTACLEFTAQQRKPTQPALPDHQPDLLT